MISLDCVNPRAGVVMINEDFWRAVRMKERNSNKSRRTGVLNIALLFGTAAIALTLIVTPMLANHKGGVAASIATLTTADPYDDIKTGSIKPVTPGVTKRETETGKRYVIRRSVLQQDPGDYCVVTGYQSGSGC